MPKKQQAIYSLHGEVAFGRFTLFCLYCGVAMERTHRADNQVTIDHVHPRSRLGTNRIENKAFVCRKCNTEKDSFTLWEWIEMGADVARDGLSDFARLLRQSHSYPWRMHNQAIPNPTLSKEHDADNGNLPQRSHR